MNNIQEIITNSYKEINFTSSAENIFRFKDFNNRLEQIDKEEVINIFKELGYETKTKKSKYEFYTDISYEKFKFTVWFDIKYGIVIPYINIYLNENKIPYDYNNFIFTYKYLINDLDIIMPPSTVYTSYIDLKIILKEVLGVYNTFIHLFITKLNNSNRQQ